jgi:hypothetical protein
MKALALAIATILVMAMAQPTAARPRDPEGFQYPKRTCGAGGRATGQPRPTTTTAVPARANVSPPRSPTQE